jgi:DNA mismatch repair protein MutL
MAKIKKLSPHIVSQIAAGEVIERPAYVVKELIENSVDASATQIIVKIKENGLKNITVSDNGVGMTKEDLLISFKSHTTSKVAKEEDLHAISSLGFRGEALASIASVADFVIESKYKKDISGYRAELKKGAIVKESIVGMPQGTTVSVSNIFQNVPARKKFLKTGATEFRHIVDIVSNFALSYTDIEFSLVHNEKEYFKLTTKHTLERRIQTLLGETLYTNLIPVTFEESYFKITGFVAHPQYSLKGQSKLFIFVNGRRVNDTLIASAVKDAYKNLLEYGAFPIALLYITLPYEMVDVNIHPRKEEIKFINRDITYSIIQKSIADTLKNQNLTFHNIGWVDGGTKTRLGKMLKNELLNEMGTIEKKADSIQLHKLYLITESKNGILIIDQHAAHEAILFRKLLALYKTHKKELKQEPLFEPILLNLSLSDKEMLIEHTPLFKSLGFEFEEFGTDIRVNNLPTIFRDRNIENFITEILEDIRIDKPIKDVDKRSYRMLSYIACRTAIKAGQELSSAERKEILDQLNEEDAVYTCPHGRPVKAELSLNYLNKLFKRS